MVTMARCFPASLWTSRTLVPAYTLVKGVAGTNEPDALPMFTIVPLRLAFMAGRAMRVICSSRVTQKAEILQVPQFCFSAQAVMLSRSIVCKVLMLCYEASVFDCLPD
jgi:hypothetical protein